MVDESANLKSGVGHRSTLRRRDLLYRGLAITTSAPLLMSAAVRATSGERFRVVGTNHGKLRGRVQGGLSESFALSLSNAP